MAVTRYQPASDMFRPLMDDFFAPLNRMGSSMRTPDTDVVESEDQIRVIAEIPGMNRDDLNVSLENNILTISGEKTEEREEGSEKQNYHLSERRWGRFSRAFVLPREVEADEISANYQNGVLTVTVPKSEKARPRQIQIEGNGQAREVGTGK